MSGRNITPRCYTRSLLLLRNGAEFVPISSGHNFARQVGFRNVDINDFKSLLKHMGICGLLTQLASGEIVVGAEGRS